MPASKFIEKIVKGTAFTAGVPTELEPTITRTSESTTATYNAPELVDRTVAHLRTVLGNENLVEREPAMGAEDFGLFGRTNSKIPIFMFRLGTVVARKSRGGEGGWPTIAEFAFKWISPTKRTKHPHRRPRDDRCRDRSSIEVNF